VCDVVTAVALRPAGRLILVAGMLVAVNPEHGGGSLSHAIWASIGFGGLAFWPAAAWRRGPSVPWGLRPMVCACAVAALVTLTAWFGTEGLPGPGTLAWPSASSAWCRHCGFSPVVLSCRFPPGAATGSPAWAR